MGRKYLTELNYTEAVASFTEAIGLDPEHIPAYMGRAEVNELTTANETAWADVSEAENGAVTAEALTAAAPTAEEISAVSLSKLYVYYGSHEAHSREGEGVWFILNPGKKDLHHSEIAQQVIRIENGQTLLGGLYYEYYIAAGCG